MNEEQSQVQFTVSENDNPVPDIASLENVTAADDSTVNSPSNENDSTSVPSESIPSPENLMTSLSTCVFQLVQTPRTTF